MINFNPMFFNIWNKKKKQQQQKREVIQACNDQEILS